MKLNSLRVCQQASDQLDTLKLRTGLTPNILCRLAFALSLKDSSLPNPDDYPPDSDRIIDRHTLTGPWDSLFVAFIKERCKQDGLAVDDDTLGTQFKAHINRGVLLLHKQTLSLKDLLLLMPLEFRTKEK